MTAEPQHAYPTTCSICGGKGCAYCVGTAGRPPVSSAATTREPTFVCPRGHRHYEGSAFCTVCGAGPVLASSVASAGDRSHSSASLLEALREAIRAMADLVDAILNRYGWTAR